MKNKACSLALAGLVALTFAGCGGNKSSESSEQPAAGGSSSAGAAVDAATAGSVSGSI